MRDAPGEPPDRFHLLGLAKLSLQRPDGGEIAHDEHDAEVLLLSALEGCRRGLDRHDAALAAGERHGGRAPYAPLDGGLEERHQLGGMAEDLGDGAPADGGRGRAAEERLGGAVQRDHAAVQIEGDDPIGQGVEDVIGVALEVGELAETPAKFRVGGLERRPPLEERRALLVELACHLVERGGELPDLVPGRRLDALDQLAPRDARRTRRELPDRPGDPARDESRGEPCSAQDQDGQEHQLAPRGGDLQIHPPA